MAKISTVLRKIRRLLFGEPAPRIAVLRFEGVIAAGSGRMRTPLNLAGVAKAIDEAFDWGGVKAVALVINSPGGSPVQSGLIADRVRARAKDRDVPVLAFTEDVAASGGYVLALAGDEIFAHEASIVGSIGVIAGGFGFKGAMERLGIERRVYTAGEKKVMLDPFSDEKEEDVERLKDIQRQIHDWFKAFVRDRRGKRLKGVRSKVFSGEVFLAHEAEKLGLIDGIGDMETVLKDRFGDKAKFRVFGAKKKGLSSLLGLADSEARAQGLVTGVIGAAEEAAHWSRFGL